MILMVSGRTDIVAFYTEWFMNRYREGFIDVRNPFYPKNISRIYFEDVDAILFCTKNPAPIIPYLNEINKPILFHITLTPYYKDIEPNVISKSETIKNIKKLSSIIDIDNIYVRYDPILLNDKYNLSFHIKAFESLCSKLEGFIKHIIISFIDDYKNVQNNRKILNYKDFTNNDYKEIGLNFSRIASKYNMTVQTCFEEENLVNYGFIKQDCLSKEIVYKLTGKTNFKKWTARKENKCNCVQMVDIGVYNSCKHFCKYCYANYDEKKVSSNYLHHNPKSSLLIGEIKEDDIIKRRSK